VDFVDVFVEWTPVEQTMEPVVPCIFHDEEEGELVGHGEEGREWNIDRKSKITGKRVE